MSDRMSIPQSGRDHNDLLEEMQSLRSGDARYKEGALPGGLRGPLPVAFLRAIAPDVAHLAAPEAFHP